MNTQSNVLHPSQHFKRLHYQEILILLNILDELEELTDEEKGVQIKLNEIKAAMEHKRRMEDRLAAESVRNVSKK